MIAKSEKKKKILNTSNIIIIYRTYGMVLILLILIAGAIASAIPAI